MERRWKHVSAARTSAQSYSRRLTDDDRVGKELDFEMRFELALKLNSMSSASLFRYCKSRSNKEGQGYSYLFFFPGRRCRGS